MDSFGAQANEQLKEKVKKEENSLKRQGNTVIVWRN